ncbi:MAG: universal stress protein [Crocinitomicaceae bacterium]
MDKRKLLIPIDFTRVTENALVFARQVADKDENELVLLHIAEEGKEAEAEEKIKTLIKTQSVDYAGEISYQISKGKVLRDIGKIARDIHAAFIIMGAHNASKLQKVFGSNAIQVIGRSKCPFIVVQEKTKYKPIKKIAMTIDLEKESIQVVKTAVKICKYFDSELILIGGKHTDPNFKQKVMTNMRIAISHLKENNIKSSVELLDRKNFMEGLMTFCKKENVAMLAATYYPDTFQIFSQKFVQSLISNELGLPLLTVDAEAVSGGSNISFISG